MGRVAAIGESVRVQGFALAGVLVLPGEGPEEARASWGGLPSDVDVVILTQPPRSRRRGRNRAPHRGDAAMNEPSSTRDEDPSSRWPRHFSRERTPMRRRPSQPQTPTPTWSSQRPARRQRPCWPMHGEGRCRRRLSGCRRAGSRRARGPRPGAARPARRPRRGTAGGSRRRLCASLRGPLPTTGRSPRYRVTRELGSEATVIEHPRGGVVGEAAGRRIEYSLDDLADDIMDRMGTDLDELWSP